MKLQKTQKSIETKDSIYQPGDKVYYKHQDSKEWKGLAEVIGHDNHQVFVKQRGLFILTHPCSLCLIQSSDRNNQRRRRKLCEHFKGMCYRS